MIAINVLSPTRADGKLYNRFKPSISKAYPVDPRYTSSNQVHLDITATRVMENLIVTNGSGNQISRLVHQMRAKKYEDLQEIFFTRVIDANIKLDIAPPTFLQWIGKYGWSGDQVHTKHRTLVLILLVYPIK
jgi:hypothetical protein